MPINYQALFDMSMSPDEGMRALAATAAKKLTPAEIQEFSAFQHAHPAGDERHRQDNSFLGAPPELAAAGAAAGVAKGIPAAANAIKDSGIVQGAMNASKGIPAAVKGGAMSYLGWEGANKVGDWLGLPAPLKTMLGLAGAHFAGGVGGANPTEEAGVPKAIPPMSDAEFAATAGRQRGEPMVGRPGQPPADPPNLERVPKATETSGGAFGRSVGGGVQNDFKGPVSIQRPGAKEAKFSETNDGADQLGQLLDATHGPNRSNMPNGGPGEKPPLSEPAAKPRVSRKPATDEAMGHSEASKADNGRQREAYTADPELMQKIREALKAMGI